MSVQIHRAAFLWFPITVSATCWNKEHYFSQNVHAFLIIYYFFLLVVYIFKCFAMLSPSVSHITQLLHHITAPPALQRLQSSVPAFHCYLTTGFLWVCVGVGLVVNISWPLAAQECNCGLYRGRGVWERARQHCCGGL